MDRIIACGSGHTRTDTREEIEVGHLAHVLLRNFHQCLLKGLELFAIHFLRDNGRRTHCELKTFSPTPLPHSTVSSKPVQGDASLQGVAQKPNRPITCTLHHSAAASCGQATRGLHYSHTSESSERDGDADMGAAMGASRTACSRRGLRCAARHGRTL